MIRKLAPVYGLHLTAVAASALVTGTMDEEALLTSALGTLVKKEARTRRRRGGG
jgi:hypothetical protein